MPPIPPRNTLFADLLTSPPGSSALPWVPPPEYYNFSYTLGGTVEEILPEGRLRQRQDDLMVLKPGGSHRWEVPADAGEPWVVVYFVVLPRPEWLPLFDLPEVFPHFTLLSLAGRPAARRVRAALRQAYRHARHGHAEQALAMNAVERALLWLRLDHAAAATDADPRVRQAMDLFAANLAEPPPIPEVAAACGLSPSRLRELFAAQTGLTPVAWQERRRLQHARDLLVTTGMPIKLVATACGFAGQRYFATRFRAFFGFTPSACRAGSGPTNSANRQ